MLAVAKVDAENRNAVIGVAAESMSVATRILEDESEQIDFTPAIGASEPNGYLVIITDGLAPAVNLNSLAVATGWQIGDKVALSTSGELARSTGEIDGPAIGKVAGSFDEAAGTVPLFVDID